MTPRRHLEEESSPSPTARGWSVIDGLSVGTKRLVLAVVALGFFVLLASKLLPLGYVLYLGGCPHGEAFVLSTAGTTTVDPHFTAKWVAVFGSDVSATCVPRCAATATVPAIVGRARAHCTPAPARRPPHSRGGASRSPHRARTPAPGRPL